MSNYRSLSTRVNHKCQHRNQGFSLIELIIVIAIMVSLVAVLAPQMTKYANNARDAVVSMAAEDALAIAKSEYAVLELTGSGTITISAPEEEGHVTVEFDGNLKYGDGDDNGEDAFAAVCGVDENKSVKTDKVYTISITEDGNYAKFSMTHN